MRYHLAFSSSTDAYRAGIEVGEGLAAYAPEVAILFFTTQYQDRMAEIAAGVRDILGHKVRLVGGSGDGIYATGVVCNHGVVALGIASDGQVQWAVGLAHGVQADSAAAAATAVRQARDHLAGHQESWAFAMANGMKADGSKLVAGLRQELSVPVFGGLAGDDRQFRRTFVLADEVVAEDAVVVLLASGGSPIRLHAASGWMPVGTPGVVTGADGVRLKTIGALPAASFVADQSGHEIGTSDLGIIPLAEYECGDSGDFALRTPSSTDQLTGEIRLFGQIRVGASVRICRASMSDIVAAVGAAIQGARDEGFEPAAAVVISCAGRRWTLSSNGREEVETVRNMLGDLPLIGIPSFGEIGPFRHADGYSQPLFHNMTFVIGLFGR
jgi:hypothetical protein